MFAKRLRKIKVPRVVMPACVTWPSDDSMSLALLLTTVCSLPRRD